METILISRIKKINVDNIDEIVEIISNNSISSCVLPEPVNLDEVIMFLSFDI